HGVYDKKTNTGVDECMIWGDYFYLEALTRLAKSWYSFW
ncbi:glucuronyl hydrolase, partial [Listeria monocytogenes]|nr:glucuronyl hydrolase [Listeria monocytogenes]